MAGRKTVHGRCVTTQHNIRQLAAHVRHAQQHTQLRESNQIEHQYKLIDQYTEAADMTPLL